jgi:hypothetical protein
MARHVLGLTRRPPAMTFNEVTKAAAKQAVTAVNITVENFRKRYVYDEDDVTGFLAGSLRTTFHGTQVGGVNLDASILRHRRGVSTIYTSMHSWAKVGCAALKPDGAERSPLFLSTQCWQCSQQAVRLE